MADSTARKSKQAAKTATRKPQPTATALRGRIPALAPAQAEALRDFFAAPQHWVLSDGGVVQFAAGEAAAVAETFAVDADGTRLLLQLDSTASPQPELHWSDYHGRSRLLAWSLAHEWPLMRLSEALGVTLLPLEAGAAPADVDGGVWLSLVIEDDEYENAERGPARLHGVLHLPAAWLARLLARAAPVYEDDPLPSLAPWRALSVPVRLGFDGPQLDVAAWQQLRPGDVIVIARGRPPTLQARTTHRAWPLVPVSRGWRIASSPLPLSSAKEPSTMNEIDVPQNHDGDAAAGTPGNAEYLARSLPVQLNFEIGRIEISVGDLASLQPGYVFALPGNLEGANVTIHANGRSVGRGEMVAVGETLGVRLLSWSQG